VHKLSPWNAIMCRVWLDNWSTISMINIICIQINHAIITEWGQPEFRCVPRPLFPTQRVWLFRLGWMGGSWERRSKGASSKEQCVV